jgi:hypothetical protein
VRNSKPCLVFLEYIELIFEQNERNAFDYANADAVLSEIVILIKF